MAPPDRHPVARVDEIWRHPVKSLQGERVESAEVVADGLRGDRAWGIRDARSGRILTGRREPRLLFASARLGADDEPLITLPDGEVVRGCGPATDAALTRWLGREVALVAADGGGAGQAEYFEDATDDTSRAIAWTMPAGRFVDALPLLLLTTASLRACASAHPGGVWDVRRFRPNLLLGCDGEGWVEDGWCGRTIAIGTTRLRPRHLCSRCTMVTRPQPGLDPDVAMFTTIARIHGACLGVWTAVATPGAVTVGDAVSIEPPG